MPKIKEKIQIAPMRFKPISEEMVDSIVNEYPVKRREYLVSKQTTWSKENLSPYDLGYNCNAYHYYSLTEWENRPKPDPDTLEIFSEGYLHEPDVIEKLKSAGYKISAFNVPFSLKWNDFLSVRGKIDLFIEKDGIPIPCEAKSMSPYAYDAINRWEDMLTSKSSYHRCYPYQLQIYLHACNKADWGLFILKNKVSGQVKLIKMPYSARMIDEIQNRVMIVSKFLKSKKGDLEQMKVKENIWCSRCDFRQQCLGDEGEKMVAIVEDKELEEMLLRRETLKPQSSEYDKLDKIIKLALKGRPELFIGDFFITGKQVQKKEYTVKAGEYWKTDIVYKGNQIQTATQGLDD